MADLRGVDELRRRLRIRDARPEDDQDPELNPDDAGDDGMVADEDDDPNDD